MVKKYMLFSQKRAIPTLCVLLTVCSFLYSVVYAQEYRLGPDDVLTITVHREDELKRKVRISSDGYISMPLLGKVKTEGLTVSELEDVLTEGFKRYLKKPQVTIFIEEYGTVTLTGQVKEPGSYPLMGDLTILEAIGQAGGFTENADQNGIKIMGVEDGHEEVITVSVDDIIASGERTEDVLLKRNDIVFVPEKFSMVTVTGQVKQPGSYPLMGELTVIEAIGLAGGFTDIAARNKVKVMRTEDGRHQTISVRVADINKTGDRTDDVSLIAGDIIYVPESLF